MVVDDEPKSIFDMGKLENTPPNKMHLYFFPTAFFIFPLFIISI